MTFGCYHQWMAPYDWHTTLVLCDWRHSRHGHRVELGLFGVIVFLSTEATAIGGVR